MTDNPATSHPIEADQRAVDLVVRYASGDATAEDIKWLLSDLSRWRAAALHVRDEVEQKARVKKQALVQMGSADRRGQRYRQDAQDRAHAVQSYRRWLAQAQTLRLHVERQLTQIKEARRDAGAAQDTAVTRSKRYRYEVKCTAAGDCSNGSLTTGTPADSPETAWKLVAVSKGRLYWQRLVVSSTAAP